MHENSFSVIISREIQRRGNMLGRQRKLKKLLPGNILRSQKVQLHVTSSPPLHLLAMWTRNVCVAPAPVTASPMVGPSLSLATEKSPPPSSASTVAEWSVALSWVRVPAPGGERAFLLLRTFPVAPPWFWDFFGDWDLWWSETRRCEWWAGMWKDQSAATSENILSLILKQFGSYGKTQQVCWLSTFSAIPRGLK